MYTHPMLCACGSREPSADGRYCNRCSGRLEAFHQDCLETAVRFADKYLWQALEKRTVHKAAGEDTTVDEWCVGLEEDRVRVARTELAAWYAAYLNNNKEE